MPFHPSPVPTISVNHPLPVEYIIGMFSSIDLPKTLRDMLLVAPRQALFCPAPLLSFSHPSFSLPVRLFRYSSILPQFLSRLTVVTRSLRPAQQLFHLWNSVQQPVHYAALCSFSPFDVTHADEILFPRLWMGPGHFGTMTCRGSPEVRSNIVRLSSLKNFQ